MQGRLLTNVTLAAAYAVVIRAMNVAVQSEPVNALVARATWNFANNAMTTFSIDDINTSVFEAVVKTFNHLKTHHPEIKPSIVNQILWYDYAGKLFWKLLLEDGTLMGLMWEFDQENLALTDEPTKLWNLQLNEELNRITKEELK